MGAGVETHLNHEREIRCLVLNLQDFVELLDGELLISHFGGAELLA